MQGLTEGRIVHYVLPDGRSEGEHRPAIVVKVWGADDGVCNLQVFTDYTNDYDPEEHPNQPRANGSNGNFWATSVQHDAEKSSGTWHWIEPA